MPLFDPVKVPARPAGAPVHAGGRRAVCGGGRAGHRGNEQGPGQTGGQGLFARICSTASMSSPLSCRPCGSERGHSPPGRPLPPKIRQADEQGREAADAPRPCSGLCSMIGPGTSGAGEYDRVCHGHDARRRHQRGRGLPARAGCPMGAQAPQGGEGCLRKEYLINVLKITRGT